MIRSWARAAALTGLLVTAVVVPGSPATGTAAAGGGANPWLQRRLMNMAHALDAAYNFVPGRSAVPGLPPESYPLRGVRTRDRRPPSSTRARTG